MKPTTKFLSVLIATQIAFSCFALAVESAKAITPSSAKASVATPKQAGKISTKKKLITKKKLTAKSKKSAAAKKVAAPATTSISANTKAAPMTMTEPKEAIETEIDTIDKMEAAATADANAAGKKAQQSTIAPTKGNAITPTTAASTTATSTTAAAVAPAETSWIKPNISLGATYNMAAEAPKEGEQNRYMDYDIIPTLVTGPIKTLVWFKYSQSLIDNSTSEWQDFPISFSVAKPYNAGEYITLSPALVFTVPQTKETKNNIQLNYSTNANVTIGLNTKNLGWDGVVLNLQTGYTKMTNEFTTSAKGEPIVSYRLRQRINFWYPIVENLSFKSRFEFNSTFSYENVVKNNFMHFVALEYGFLEKYNVNIGTTNGGPTMAGPNYENNLKFYNEESSELFLGVGADF